MSAMGIFRAAVWGLIAGCVAIIVYFGALQPRMTNELPPAAAAGADSTSGIGGPFTMTAHTGETVTEATYSGKPWLMFMGFTHCPDICPTTLAEMTSWFEELGSDADLIQAFLVTVDPERDTVDVLAQYMTSFDERILALRPAPEELERFAKAFEIHYEKVPFGEDDYTMDHTAGVLMFDSEGEFSGTLDLHEPRDTTISKLRRLIGKDRTT